MLRFLYTSTHNCVGDLDARGGHIHIDAEPSRSLSLSGELVHGLIQNFHSHSMRHVARSNVGALYSLVVFVAPVCSNVARHRAGTHSRSVG